MCISTICPARSLIRGPGTVPLNVQKSYVTPSANCPSFSSVIRLITTLLAGEGADGISVGDKLRFGAYAGCPALAETKDAGNVNDTTETAINKTRMLTLIPRLGKRFGALMYYRERAYSLLVIAIVPNMLGRFQDWKSSHIGEASFPEHGWTAFEMFLKNPSLSASKNLG